MEATAGAAKSWPTLARVSPNASADRLTVFVTAYLKGSY